jgi:hypothetical protein
MTATVTQATELTGAPPSTRLRREPERCDRRDQQWHRAKKGLPVMTSPITSEQRTQVESGIREKYASVAAGPDGQFAYSTGRNGLERLGYDRSLIAKRPNETAAKKDLPCPYSLVFPGTTDMGPKSFFEWLRLRFWRSRCCFTFI